MNRERSNFQSCQILEEYWRTNTSIKFGYISQEQMSYIKETLELQKRNKLELQDVRDFAVIYFAGLSKNVLHDIMWDCMSAITAVLDGFKMTENNV